ncbi:lipopolysaccharide kinase InaA family protein [Aliarcobacter butzleri]|uniref:lipopolysaccharide kinase InaA family protein n=1 Tax=Aliarcobacter butzleri TaxID=28197 RepID=UPI0024DE8E2A|nr:lipopolysaccharide kinase InaA family protein [Aliarcobacter butzleri]MDK2047742.1 lipopolysaccharide kinase InaA family protein [Aliarcobacter butzleri]
MSNYKFTLNEEFKNFEYFLCNIRKFFNENKETIHKARNEIKVIIYENKKVVVKSFKIPHFINKIVYTFFKKSKAQKSYEYALKINEFTPKPIGYVEFYKFGLLNESYFVSEKFEYNFTIREPLLDINYPNKNKILKAFAKFTFDLHQAGIFHFDYSPGNILIKEENDNFIFKIVDINRMKFFDLELDDRLKNFSKLWAKDDDLKIIIKEYAKFLKVDENELIVRAINFSHKHKAKINLKKRLKGKKVVD